MGTKPVPAPGTAPQREAQQRARPLRQRAHRERLRETGHPLDQDVAATEEADEQPIDQRFLPDDDLRRLRLYLLDEAALLAHPRIDRVDVYGHTSILSRAGWLHWEGRITQTPGRGEAAAGCRCCVVSGERYAGDRRRRGSVISLQPDQSVHQELRAK